MKQPFLRIFALGLATATVLSGCATTGGTSSTSGGGDKKCNPWATGVVGAVLGAAIGSTRDRDAAVKGAVAGAAIGALGCLAINATSRQTQTAETVEGEYRKANSGALPSAPAVLAYDISVSPYGKVAAGQPIEVKTQLKIVDGTAQKVSSVREELILLDTSGKEIRRVGKDVSGTAGGGYENTFTFAFPKGVSQGVYGVKTELLVNGKVVDHNAEALQLVFEPMLRPFPVAMH